MGTITRIWKVTNRTDKVIKYAKNEAKTDINNSKFNTLDSVLNYATNGDKTEKKFFVTAINCEEESAYEEMQDTKRFYNKTDGILAYHGVQSFDDKKITPQLAHEIGVRLVDEMWGDRFQAIVTTHLNTNHIHNHFVVNSVSFKDGKKYYSNRTNTAVLRKLSDDICQEYGIDIYKNPKVNKVNLDNYYKKYLRQDNYSKKTKEDIDFAIGQAYSYLDFIKLMKKMGYVMYERNKTLSVRKDPYKRNIRVERRYGEFYSIENIKKRIIDEDPVRVPMIITKRKNIKFKGTSKRKIKVTGFMAIYFHYMYMLNLYPKKPFKRMSYSLIADIQKMDKYSEEAKFLATNKINNEIELENIHQVKFEELKDLECKREKLWDRNRKTSDEEIKYDNCRKISLLNNEIDDKRREVALIEDIKERIPKIKEKINEQKLEDRKETEEIEERKKLKRRREKSI